MREPNPLPLKRSDAPEAGRNAARQAATLAKVWRGKVWQVRQTRRHTTTPLLGGGVGRGGFEASERGVAKSFIDGGSDFDEPSLHSLGVFVLDFDEHPAIDPLRKETHNLRAIGLIGGVTA